MDGNPSGCHPTQAEAVSHPSRGGIPPKQRRYPTQAGAAFFVSICQIWNIEGDFGGNGVYLRGLLDVLKSIVP